MVHEVLRILKVRPHTGTTHRLRQDGLIGAMQILHMSLANSSEQDSAKLGKPAPSHTRLTSQPPIRLVNILPRYEELNSRSSRPCTDSSARATASSGQNAHWHTSFQMAEGSIDRTDLLEGSSISAAGWILNYTSNQILLWHTHS